MTLRDKLKEINLRLVELANYLNISRPTMYKYLESYEQRDYSKIDKITFDLFSFIDSNQDLTKPAVMNYLINNIVSADQVFGENYVAKIAEAIKKLKESPNEEDKNKLKRIEEILFDK
jgi:predicted transcriptional regulator